MNECMLTKAIVATAEQCIQLCCLLLAVLVLRGCRGQVYFGRTKHSTTSMSSSSAVAIESLSEEQIDIFIREEQLDDADPLRHLRHQDSDDLLPLVPAQPPTIHNETLHLNFQDIIVTLQVDAGPGCGGIAWPAGEVLSRYIVRQGRDYWRGKRVLELGSGTGLVGLVAGYLGAHTVLTDQRSASRALPNWSENK